MRITFQESIIHKIILILSFQKFRAKTEDITRFCTADYGLL